MDTVQPRNTLREIMFVLVMFVLVIIIGVVFYQRVEGLRFVDAVYFTSMTLTTVGYGDFVPQTDTGKIFTSVYAFLGIGTFLGVAGILFRNAMAYSRAQASKLYRPKKGQDDT